MQMNRKIALGFIAALALAPLPAFAHHSYAMFDHTKEVTLKDATVVSWEWTSPHTWLYVLVPNGTKDPTKFSVEGGNPGLLRRLGFSKGSMSPGDKVTVFISPLKSGDKGGALNAVQLGNGQLLGERTRLIQ